MHAYLFLAQCRQRSHGMRICNVTVCQARDVKPTITPRVIRLGTKTSAADHQVDEAVYRNIVNIAADAIVAVDSAQNVVLFNEGAEKCFGYNAEDVIGEHLSVLLPGASGLAHEQHIGDFGRSLESARRMGERREVYGRRKNGETFPADAT